MLVALSGPGITKKAQCVPVQDAVDVRLVDTGVSQHRRKTLQVSDRVHVYWGQLRAEATIHVSAYGDVGH